MTDLRDGRGAADQDDDAPEPPALRRLRLLVSALMIVLIAGMITVAGALVIRLGFGGATVPGPGPQTLAEPIAAGRLTLPEGARIRAVGRAPGEVLLVTEGADGARHLRAFDAGTGAPRSVTEIRATPSPSGR